MSLLCELHAEIPPESKSGCIKKRRQRKVQEIHGNVSQVLRTRGDVVP